ncbi:endonuclease IV [Candidatus Pacearchaeota archaeon]|jgi:deoxyribonuclease-4|nr:endonuclease IV [Candidatus Pacearchaeota archaeon]
MTIRFGPAGLGPIKTAVQTLEKYHQLGFKACEISFTHGPYIKKEEDMKLIKETAEKLNISLSIHAQYWINLNSKEPEKVEASKKRILNCCEIGEKLGAKRVVFHPGYYSDMTPEEAYKNISKSVKDLQQSIKKENWKIKISAETMGKVNVFGSTDQISNLVNETGCDFCIDFAHILARDKSVDYDKVKQLFPQSTWHVHFSGIVYGEKGEKHHKTTLKEEWKTLLANLPKDKEITIINESPTMIDDTIEGLELSKKL